MLFEYAEGTTPDVGGQPVLGHVGNEEVAADEDSSAGLVQQSELLLGKDNHGAGGK